MIVIFLPRRPNCISDYIKSHYIPGCLRTRDDEVTFDTSLRVNSLQIIESLDPGFYFCKNLVCNKVFVFILVGYRIDKEIVLVLTDNRKRRTTDPLN